MLEFFCGSASNPGLMKGGLVVISGPSGIGKTTLIESWLGLRDDFLSNSGFKNIAATKLSEFVYYLPQTPGGFSGSLIDCLCVDKIDTFIVDILHRLNIGYLTERDWNFDVLSGGEIQRLAIARAVAAGRDWLVADEPTSGLDRENALGAIDLIASQFVGAILVSHDVNVMARADLLLKLCPESKQLEVVIPDD